VAARSFRFLITAGLVFGLAACVAAPVSVSGNAPALKVAQPSMAIGVGQEKDLLPFIRVASTGAVPFIPLTWEVSNPSLLSIDPSTGRAKGLSKGSVVVQVKAPGNDAGATQLMIEVMGEGAAVVKDVKVIPATHHMVLGESVTLRAEVQMPDGQVNGNVIWASSDDTIATVNRTNGAVTALKPGRVTVLAAYAPSPEFKGIADVFIYSTRGEIPASPPAAPIISQDAEGPPSTSSAPRPSLPSDLPSSQSQQPSGPSATVITTPTATALTPVPALASATPELVNAAPTPIPTAVGASQAPASPQLPAPGSAPPMSPGPVVSVAPTPAARLVVNTLAGSTAGFTDGAGLEARFAWLEGITINASGQLFVTDSDNLAVRQISPTGMVSTLARTDGSNSEFGFTDPRGIAVDASGVVFVADGSKGRIRRVSKTGQISTLAWTPRPFGLAVEPTGNLWATQFASGGVARVTMAGAVLLQAGSGESGFADGRGTSAMFANPSALAFDNSGNVFIADEGNQRIRKLTPAGDVTTFAGSGVHGFFDGSGTQAQFRGPRGLAFDSEGNLYIADVGNRRIRKVTPDGNVSTVAGSGAEGFTDGEATSASFVAPTGVAVDVAGNIYVADKTRIRVIRRQ
jgi:sugar lactone lactonase YvrE